MDLVKETGIQYAVLSCISATLILFASFSYLRISNKQSKDKYFFIAMIICALSCMFDSFYGLRTYNVLSFPDWFNYLVTIIFTLAGFTSAYFWLCYSERIQKSWISKKWTRFLVYTIPFAFAIIFTIITPFTKLYFYFENGEYLRGPVFLILTTITTIITFVSGTSAFVRSFKKENYAQRANLWLLFLYTISLVLVQFIQLTFSSSLPTKSLGFSIVFIIIVFQHLKINIKTDPLTKLNNRFALDAYLEETFNNKQEFGIAFLDIDKFKRLNDTYGHNSGDKALIIVANTIAETLPNHFFVARFGGDEFVIIGNNNIKEYEELENKINIAIEKKVKEKKLEFPITISVGYLIKDETFTNVPDLLEAVDKKLYERKEQKPNR